MNRKISSNWALGTYWADSLPKYKFRIDWWMPCCLLHEFENTTEDYSQEWANFHSDSRSVSSKEYFHWTRGASALHTNSSVTHPHSPPLRHFYSQLPANRARCDCVAVTCSLTLRKEPGIRVFESRILRWIFRPLTDENDRLVGIGISMTTDHEVARSIPGTSTNFKMWIGSGAGSPCPMRATG